jgi:hypothetical protein
MSKINYFKNFYYTRWCDRWYVPIAYRRYKWVDDVIGNDVNRLNACEENYNK